MFLNHLFFEFWPNHPVKTRVPNVTHDLWSHQHFSIASLEDWPLLFIIFHPWLSFHSCFFLLVLIHLLCCDFFYPISFSKLSPSNTFCSPIVPLHQVHLYTWLQLCSLKISFKCTSPTNSVTLNYRWVSVIPHWACSPHYLINGNQWTCKWPLTSILPEQPSPIPYGLRMPRQSSQFHTRFETFPKLP